MGLNKTLLITAFLTVKPVIVDRMSDGGDDFHLFVEDVCVHSLFVFSVCVCVP